LRTPAPRSKRQAAPANLSARVGDHIILEAELDGRIVARFGGHSVGLGAFSPEAARLAQDLHKGLPLASFTSARRNVAREIDLLVRRLARCGLLEYRLGHARKREEQVVIEPQVPEYWPRTPRLRASDVLVLSRFAYTRRRGNDMVLESPLAPALFRICNPRIAGLLALLSTPRQVNALRRQAGLSGDELLALLLDCRMLFKIETAGDDAARRSEGDDNLVLWDFHDLLFHARSTEGRHANPLGGVYPYAGTIPALPAVRPCWPGNKIELSSVSGGDSRDISPFAALLRNRHSTRDFDDARPITLAELARFLDGAARVLSRWKSGPAAAGDPVVDYAVRPYPSAGASHELELYLAIHRCDGLERGVYHYDADGHALVSIGAALHDLEALLTGAQLSMGASAAPQIVILIAARFGRISWKYSSIAYALILKNVGVLLQTFYLMATDMGLGGCAIGSVNVDLFARMTGIELHVEGPVGQFVIGRGAPSSFADD